VTTLNAYGVNIVDVLTHWEVTAVAAPIHSARMVHFERDAGNPARCHALGESGQVPLAAYLAGFDIVVNCVLQHTDAPLMFVTDDDLAALASSRTRTSCPFSTAQHNIRIRGSSNATTRGPEHPSLLICSENIE
jgi:hypothetical protein